MAGPVSVTMAVVTLEESRDCVCLTASYAAPLGEGSFKVLVVDANTVAVEVVEVVVVARSERARSVPSTP